MLVDASTAHPGGGLSYLAAQLPRLERHGVQLLVVAPEKVVDALEAVVPAAEFRRLRGRSVCRAVEARVRLPLLARRWRADVVYCPGSTSPALTGAPRVLLIQNPHLFTDPAPRNTRLSILRILCWLSAWSATRVVHISHAMAAQFELTTALRCPTSVAWSGPGALAATGSVATAAQPRPPYLLTVGDLYWYKRTDLLIAAYACDPELRDRYEVVIAGADYLAEGGRLRALVAAEGLSARVHFLGFVAGPDLSTLYAGAAAYVSLSEREAFPLTPAEALSLGAPVVLSDTPFFRELYGPWATFVAGREPAAIAQAIAQAIASGAESGAEAASIEDVRARFSWDRNAELVVSELRRAAAAGVPTFRERLARVQPTELTALVRTIAGDAATRVV